MARKKKPPEHVNHERWLVSYADFITLLFAFFTTLYAISTVDQKKAGKLMFSMLTALNVEFFPNENPAGLSGFSADELNAVMALAPRYDQTGANMGRPVGAAEVLGRQQNGMSGLAQELAKLADTAELKGRVQIRVEKRGVVVSLAEAGFFESGSAELRAGALQALDVLVEKLAQRHDLDITVEGHTDNVPCRGRFHSNWELSTARATFVISYFLSRYAFDPIHLSASGYAEFRPVADNSTPDGRARNRRVDIVLQTVGQSAQAPVRPAALEKPSVDKMPVEKPPVEAPPPAPKAAPAAADTGHPPIPPATESAHDTAR